MAAPGSTPLLRSKATYGGVRLELGNWGYGSGRTLEAAADDLIRRLSTMALGLRNGAFRYSSETVLPDREFLDFLWELSEIADRPEDVRRKLFG